MLRHWRFPAVIAVVAACALAPAAVSGACPQSPGAEVQPTPKAPAAGEPAASSVSLNRIRRMLRETPPTAPSGASSLLKLQYYVEVVGTPPTIDFFKDFNIGKASSVQYGGMTHDEFLRITAPFWRKW